MSSPPFHDSIKEALFGELKNILSADASTRNRAEERLKQLKFTDGYGVYLAEITMNQSLEPSLRQLASVMLKQYVESHWTAGDDDEDPLVAPEHAKKVIKSILPEGLYDPNSKIRSVVAYTISTIASHDWPADWSELFEIIVKCLGGNENSVHGAMQVLVEFTYDLDTHIAEVGPMILSEVYRIFEADHIYAAKTRSSAVEILTSVLKSINRHVENKAKVAQMVSPVLPAFVQRLILGLSAPIGAQSTFSLKMEIVKSLTYMAAEMPKFIQPYLVQILSPVWQLLTQMAEVYIKVVVNQTEKSPFGGKSGGGGDGSDSDEDGEDFTKMILQVFEFVHSIIESKKFKSSVAAVLPDLIYVIVIYMEMTEEQVESWSEDHEKFVEEEDEQGVNFSVRISGRDVITMIGEEFGADMLPALSEALTKHISLSDAARSAGDPHWWKIQEASMIAVGCHQRLILEHPSAFDLAQYLTLVRSLSAYEASPFLTGRCLSLLTLFVESIVFGDAALSELIDKTARCFEPAQPAVLKISAARAIHALCNNLGTASEERRRILIAKLGAFFDGIFSPIGSSQGVVLGLFLECLGAIIAFDPAFTASIQSRIIPLTIACFLKYHDDRYILDLVQDLLKTLSQNVYCLAPLQEKLVPTLVSILSLQGEHSNAAMQDIALDVLETIVKFSTPPLSEALMDQAFPAAVACILRTEDHTVMQSGGECLRAFLTVAPEQVCRYKNGEGLNSVMQVTTMLLNPLNTEFTATFIGRLVITLITKAGAYLGENIDFLLKAVISKMQLVESLAVHMSLVTTFAHLILIRMEAVLNFLATVPGPTGEPAMRFVFNNWLSRQHLFYGRYERKVTIMALCRLFEHGIQTRDPRLLGVEVRECVVLAPSSAVKTRAQAAANQQWVSVPVLVKIFRLLLNELANLREWREADQQEVDTDEDASGEEGVGGGDDSRNLSAYMLGDFEGEDTEGDEDDAQMMAELMADPVFQADSEEVLTKFIRNFSQDEQFKELLGHLGEPERRVLRSINVSV